MPEVEGKLGKLGAEQGRNFPETPPEMHSPSPVQHSPYVCTLKALCTTSFWFSQKSNNSPPCSITKLLPLVGTRVHLTGGNRSGLTGYRSNRSGPVPVSVGTQPAKIQILNLNAKNEKFPKKILKILQGVMNLMVSNFLKNSFI